MPIQVDEDAHTASVPGGVGLRPIMDVLSRYRSVIYYSVRGPPACSWVPIVQILMICCICLGVQLQGLNVAAYLDTMLLTIRPGPLREGHVSHRATVGGGRGEI